MSRRRDERGSFLPVTALMIAVVMGFSSFAVDLGLERVARRDMQSLSDIVAMDLSRQMKGRSVATIQADPAWTATKNRSVARNHTLGAAPTVTPVLGSLNNATGDFTPLSGSAVPNAVKVTAATSVNFVFKKGRSGGTSRYSIATIEPVTCFSVGSYALGLNTDESPLNAILGGIVGVSSLTVLGSGGIASLKNVTIPLAGLATQLGVATPNDLANLNIKMSTFLVAAATVLDNQGNTAQAALLNSTAAKLKLLSKDTTYSLGKLLSFSTSSASALNANINLLDLVTGALYLANGTSAISIPNLSISLPGIGTNISVKATVVSPPQIACGGVGATAKSAQVSLSITGPLTSGLLSILVSGNIDIGIAVASATGTLTSMTCATGSSGSDVAVIQAQSALVKDLSLAVKQIALLNLLGIPLLPIGTVGLTAASLGSSGTQNLSFTYPSTGLPPAQSISAIGLNLGNLTPTVGNVSLSDGLKIVSALDTSILSPLLTRVMKLLGVSLGGADVEMLSRIDCASPRLSGTS